MRSSTRFPARLGSRSAWPMCLCLLTLLQACAAPPATIRPAIDPPPANLAAECWAGPQWPAGDSTVGQVLEIVAQREAAAAECRARHRALVKAWPSI